MIFSSIVSWLWAALHDSMKLIIGHGKDQWNVEDFRTQTITDDTNVVAFRGHCASPVGHCGGKAELDEAVFERPILTGSASRSVKKGANWKDTGEVRPDQLSPCFLLMGHELITLLRGSKL